MNSTEGNKKKRFMDRYLDGPRSQMKGKYILCFAFTIIPIISFFVFYVGGNYYSFFLAFTRFKGLSESGKEMYYFSLQNFVGVFNLLKESDSSLIIALKNTGILWIMHWFQLAFNFVIAYTFTKKLKLSGVFRVIIYLPSIISALVLSIVVKNVIGTDGPIALIWQKYNEEPFPALFQSEETAYKTLMIYCWWAGLYQSLLLFEGSIRRVPKEVLESAQLDGVNARQELFLIIIPIMWDTISTMIVLNTCSLFTISAPILLFTDGQYNTQTLSFWFYQQVYYNSATKNINNLSAAVGLVITILNLPIVFGVKKLCSKVSDGLEY